jgi:hypothetical protein
VVVPMVCSSPRACAARILDLQVDRTLSAAGPGAVMVG